MLVRDVMTRNPECVAPNATLQEAAQTMRMLDVGPLPVCDADGCLVGMVTDRDVTIRATAEGREPFTTYVGDIMSPDVSFVYEDQRIEDAAQVMQQRQVRRVPVLDRGNRRLVGIVSLGDLAMLHVEEAVDDEDLVADTLESVSIPE